MIQYKVKCSRHGLRSDVCYLFFFVVLIFFLKDGDTYNIGEKIFYEILVGYFTVRFLGELLLSDSVPETDIREHCNCTMCSGISILN